MWEAVASAAGVTLERPALAMALEGAAMRPSGRVEFAAGRIGLSGEGLPAGGLDLRALQLEATVNAGEILVPVLRAEVDGQRVEADGRLVLTEGARAGLRARPFVWLLQNAEARLRLPEAEVAALARYLPKLLAPTGTVEAELRLSPGSRLDGRVKLRDGNTRPLGDFGVLHDIDLDLVLAGMEMRVERASARAGGQEVAVTGSARRVPGRGPVLDLALKAERFPLVRKPGLIFRGDLNLTVKTNEATGQTRVGGAVVLRDSLVLADIRPLLAVGGGGPAAAGRARPPYFSVDTPPIGDWTLGVTVRGERFVRIRTPVFEGRGSAAFALEGTLREPRVSGEFTVDPGRILFPFASFTVQEGAVRILRNDPYTARLDFRASGRRLGYDLRLEIDGTEETPQMRLFSTPALDAETLLLMITAGVAPAEGQTAGTGQRLAAVGAYVGRDLLRTFGIANSDEERLTIRSGQQVSRGGRETYGFDYRLTDKWSVVGDYDEFDAYNMGVRRRFRAKEPEALGGGKGEDGK
jgi:translocation and assembly module TamB